MQKLLVLSFLLTLSILGKAQTADTRPAPPSTSKWGRLTDSTYTIRFPGNWSVDQSGQFGSRFFLFAPFEAVSDTFRENFNLIINDISLYPYATLEFISDGARGQVASRVTAFQEIEYRIVHHGDDQYYLFEYTGKQGKFDLHWKQMYLVEKGKFYVLTFTAEAPEYARYVTAVQRIFASFKLK